jgi:DNA-binding winged helix-turn-helix (wHTH) protein
VKIQEQPLKLLHLLAERPGEIVSRDEIRQALWGRDTYVDFERSINFCVNQIRAALRDDPQHPRYIETVPRHGYRFIAEVSAASTNNGNAESAAEAGAGSSPNATSLPPRLGQRKAILRLALLLLLCLGLASVGLIVSLRPKQAAAPAILPLSLVRLTFDPGVQLGATFSPDGRFIAYSSDRGGKFDIWIQQEGSVNPTKVTTRPGHNWQPDWSPDGHQIAFRSEGEGGGLFVVPAFGGPERKIASFGYRPRWSPDGEQILFDGYLQHMALEQAVPCPSGRASTTRSAVGILPKSAPVRTIRRMVSRWKAAFNLGRFRRRLGVLDSER